MIDIRAERRNRGLSLEDAAEEIGVSRNTLERAEKGVHTPHARNAFKIASFYGHQVTDVWPLDADPTKEAA